MNESCAKLKPNFSPSGMEKFTLKAGSIFLSEVFQFIIIEKCNKLFFFNVTRIFAYAIAQILSSHALYISKSYESRAVSRSLLIRKLQERYTKKKELKNSMSLLGDVDKTFRASLADFGR